MSPNDDLHGRVAGRYDLLRELGRGGSASVYLAHDRNVGSQVAIKFLHEEYAGSRFAERFAQEIRLMAECHHANILPVLDSGEHDGLPFYVTLFVDGETLEARLRRERRLPLEDVLEIARDLCSALSYAHALKIVHRDIKPSNILLAGTHTYLSDFGIAKALAPIPGQPHTSAGTAVGTRAYMSPEQATADTDLDGRSDIYSLACVLFEALAGQHPFYSADEMRSWSMRFTEPPDSLRRHRESVPPHIESAIARALERDPADRWQSVREFADALGLGTGTPAGGVAIPVTVSSNVPVRNGGTTARGWRRIVIGAALLAAVGAAAVWAGRTSSASCGTGTSGDPRLVFLMPSDSGADASQSLVATLERAATRWRDVTVTVDRQTASNARRDACRALAGGATHVALVGGSALADSRDFSATVYTAGADGPVERTISLVTDSAAPPGDAAAERMIATVLASPRGLGALDYAATLSQHWKTWTEYRAARDALDAGYLPLADSLLRAVTAREPTFAPGLAWGWNVQSWRDGRFPPAPTIPIDSAAFGSVASPAERAMLQGIVALSSRDFPAACAAFDAVDRADDAAGLALLSLGECLLYDDVVVRVPPAGALRFRSDASAAARAYRQALAVCRAALCEVGFARLERVSPIAPTIREGVLPATGVPMAAIQEWRDGRITHTPIPAADIFAGRPGSVPPSLGAALQAARAGRAELAAIWLERDPGSALAHRAMAHALEMQGVVGSPAAARATSEQTTPSALGEIARALALAADPATRLALTLDRARLLLRAGAFAAVVPLADSLLDAPRRGAEDATALRDLAGLATAVGRTATAAQLLRARWQDDAMAGGEMQDVPIEVRSPASELLVLSVAGACGDTLRTLESEVRRRIGVHLPANRREDATRRMIAAALQASAACDHYAATLHDPASLPLLQVQQLVARGEHAAARRRMMQLEREQHAVATTDVALDFTLQFALLLAAEGDTTGAVRRLSDALDGVSSSTSFTLGEIAQTAALGRSRFLLARWLTGNDGRPAAERWKREAETLWKNCDAIVRPSR